MVVSYFVNSISEVFIDFMHDVNDIKSFGNYLATVPIFPVFLTVHFLLTAIAYRTRVGTLEFSKNHPLASWFVCMVTSFGGAVVANFLLGESIVGVFKNEKPLLVASGVWYLMFFCPFDLLWSLCQIRFIKAILLVLKEVQRVRVIQAGVQLALNLHPKSWLIIIIIGAVPGSGGKFLMKPLDHFIRGEVMTSNELLAPHFATKSAVVISSLFWLEYTNQIDISETSLIAAIVAIMSAFQLAFLLTDLRDPYTHVEKALTYLFIKLPKEVLSKDTKVKGD